MKEAVRLVLQSPGCSLGTHSTFHSHCTCDYLHPDSIFTSARPPNNRIMPSVLPLSGMCANQGQRHQPIASTLLSEYLRAYLWCCSTDKHLIEQKLAEQCLRNIEFFSFFGPFCLPSFVVLFVLFTLATYSLPQ
jgi:hypothetical protein